MKYRPIFSFRPLLYISSWLLISVFHFLLVRLQYNLPATIALSEVLIFNISYALLGIGLWFMVKVSDYEKLPAREVMLRLAASSSISLVIWLGIGYYLLKNLPWTTPVYRDFLDETLTARIIAGLLLYIIMVMVFYLIINNENLKQHRNREQLLQNLLHESELNTLRSQIKPHFLFNSLNSISSLTITDPAKAQEMVINLSDFMRYSLNLPDSAMSTLRQELYHLRLYLEIEKVRFGGRLVVEELNDENALDWPLPPMILQPLVENAVKHGVYDTPGKSNVRIECVQDGQWLEVSVFNNYDPELPNRKGSGTGLSNVMKRMSMLYGMTNLVRINKTDQHFEVKLKFPNHVKDTGDHSG